MTLRGLLSEAREALLDAEEDGFYLATHADLIKRIDAALDAPAAAPSPDPGERHCGDHDCWCVGRDGAARERLGPFDEAFEGLKARADEPAPVVVSAMPKSAWPRDAAREEPATPERTCACGHGEVWHDAHGCLSRVTCGCRAPRVPGTEGR